MRLLFAEDDPMIGAGVRQGLAQEGFAVDWVRDGAAAELALAENVHEAVLLDLGLPRKDGLDVLAAMRRRGDQRPVLVLTARDALSDRVAGLDAGADDYLVKPFALSELVARLRALVRRHDMRRSEQLILAALRYDAAARRAWVGERAVALSARECVVLQYLMLRTGQIVPREQLAALVPGWDASTSNNALELLMSRLRAKIEPAGVRLRTVRGFGYLLEPAAPE